jgi:hypothetical protein
MVPNVPVVETKLTVAASTVPATSGATDRPASESCASLTPAVPMVTVIVECPCEAVTAPSDSVETICERPTSVRLPPRNWMFAALLTRSARFRLPTALSIFSVA